jgi:DsbC/DsbD-like thiol-disulfide interchange protein
MTRVRPLIAIVAGVVTAATLTLNAQIVRPHATLSTQPESPRARKGSPVTLTLKVTLPEKIHVQAHKPRDPSLIPTVLTIDAPAGVTVDRIVYPTPVDFAQTGQRQPLAVFGPQFTIEVQVTPIADVRGPLVLPARLKYQACDVAMCFPPSTAAAQWTVTVLE